MGAKPYFTPSTKVHMAGPSSVPSAMRSSARWMSPESKISSSGFTPASRITFAMRRTFFGVLITTSGPEFMVLRSSEHTSGRMSAMCSTRFSGGSSVVPGAAIFGSSSLGMKRPPGPVVRFTISSRFSRRMRSTTSRYSSISIEGLPVSGWRTWMCTCAAPASAAARHSSAICTGVIGRCGVCSGFTRLPVTAQVMSVFALFTGGALRRPRCACR
ncbi:hypothetical protein FQZ97_863870 [compost metagenome]